MCQLQMVMAGAVIALVTIILGFRIGNFRVRILLICEWLKNELDMICEQDR